jgi:hypothetical protein
MTIAEFECYKRTIQNLFDILLQCNAGYKEDALEWQIPLDASTDGAYGHLRQAIISLAGESLYGHWLSTSEIDWRLSNRTGIRKTDFLMGFQKVSQ